MTDHGHHIEERLEHMVADHPDDHSHGGLGLYMAVFAALCVLTGMSFLTYTRFWPFQDQKQVTWAFMMAVSCTKAMLVITFFMHLLWEANWKWVLTIPASMMSVFLLLMLVPDVGLRQDNGWAWYSRDRWLYTSNKPPVQESISAALRNEQGNAPGHAPAPAAAH
jgi:cytochrome c oxidase subunit 4